jgi:hypothetical protein
MRVERIHLQHLYNNEWHELHTDFKATAAKYGPETLRIGELWEPYLTHLSKADKNLIKIDKSIHTAEMKAADKERDLLVTGFHRAVKISLNLPDAAKKDAAKRLLNIVHPYKVQAIKVGYAAESSLIDNLLRKLNDYTADITLLALDGWVSSLRETEEKFNTFRSKRLKESIGKPKEKIKAIRLQVDGYYRSMIDIIYARLLADGLGGKVVVDPESLDTVDREDNDPTPPFLRGNPVYNFVIEWNTFMRSYRSTLAARTTRTAHKKQHESVSIS